MLTSICFSWHLHWQLAPLFETGRTLHHLFFNCLLLRRFFYRREKELKEFSQRNTEQKNIFSTSVLALFLETSLSSGEGTRVRPLNITYPHRLLQSPYLCIIIFSYTHKFLRHIAFITSSYNCFHYCRVK